MTAVTGASHSATAASCGSIANFRPFGPFDELLKHGGREVFAFLDRIRAEEERLGVEGRCFFDIERRELADGQGRERVVVENNAAVLGAIYAIR